MSLERNPSRDRLLKTPPHQKPMQDDDVGVDRGEQQLAQPMPTTTAMRSTPVRGTSIFTKCTPGAVQSLDIQLERIVVRSDSIDLDHPAPLLLGGEYSVRIRFGSYSFSTTPVVCCEPKEVVYKGQQACITLKPVDGSEKLRFSLLEGKRQVARFSLDPAKLKADVKEWKEYAIPFRYNPTGQRTALDVRVRRVETNGNRSPMNWRASPQPPAAITASSTAADAHATTSSNTAPKPLVDTTSPSNVHAESGADSHAPRWSWSPEHPHNTTNPVAQKASQACSRLRSSPHRGLETSIDANTPTSGPLASSDTNRTNTPLRGSQWSAKDADQTVSGYRRARACEASSVQGGWEHTFMQQRPPPLTSNLADLPADRRPPSEHEKYIAEVLARLERHQQGPRQHTSLEEEWVGWREQRERSRCDSVSDMHGRSTSVNSVVSRADSVVSVVSRRASAPRPTHSNADHAVMTPFSPDTSAYRHHRRRRSPPARNPLI
ncbi:hypothetical protein JKF63_00880 [Porcisia hertigi]|uniref:Uncharacterized protein n=1 Tax=Porcisia hertigi TaxID=2761500 RepID=A0A836HZV5_9TRYP|nr:hypothetical protein JKF63_00880 [Porcisia hertigi]